MQPVTGSFTPKIKSGERPYQAVPDNQLPGDEPKLIQFGDRLIQKVDLAELGVQVSHGRIGALIGHGNYGSVHEFYPDKPESLPSDGQKNTEWVFKPEFPHDKLSLEKAIHSINQFPLSENGWLHSSLRSVVSCQIAKAIGVDNLVETHLAYAGNTPGIVMKRIKGPTVRQWLESAGYYEQEGLKKGYNPKRLHQLKYSKKGTEEREKYREIMKLAFEASIRAEGLEDDWVKIQCADYVTGQVDRMNLSNMMLSKQDGKLRLIGVDNDLSLPETNEHLDGMVVPHKSECISPSHSPESYGRIVKKLLPGSLAAYQERASLSQQRWFMQGSDNNTLTMQLGGSAQVNPLGFGSGSGSGRRSDIGSDVELPGAKNTVFYHEIATSLMVHEPEPRSRLSRCCIIL